MVNFVKSFAMNDSGASAAEYALILAIVGTGIALAAIGLGNAIKGSISGATKCINAPNTTGC
jgi:pilus assembly protein Flp/PilA